MINSIVDKPLCPNCKKPMRLIATGRLSKMFFCVDCKEKVTVEKEKPELELAVNIDSNK
jgi:predicted amidophosphoribosyltransferase